VTWHTAGRRPNRRSTLCGFRAGLRSWLDAGSCMLGAPAVRSPPSTRSTGPGPACERSPHRLARRPATGDLFRSASDSLSADRCGSRFAGRCSATTAGRIACRDRPISWCSFHADASSATARRSGAVPRQSSDPFSHLRARSNWIRTRARAVPGMRRRPAGGAADAAPEASEAGRVPAAARGGAGQVGSALVTAADRRLAGTGLSG